MTTRTLLPATFLTLALIGLGGCRKESAPSNDPASSSKGSATASAKPERKQPADEGIDVPTEEDFEEAVEKEITADTDLQKELDKLEKDIQ